MPITPLERYRQGQELGQNLTEPFGLALEILAARRFAELDRRRESAEAKETVARYYELTGDQARGDQIRGITGAFPPALAPMLIERAEKNREIREAEAIVTSERIRAAEDLRAGLGVVGFPGAAGRIPQEIDPGLVGTGIEAALNLRRSRFEEAGALQRAQITVSGQTGVGAEDTTERNRDLTAVTSARTAVEDMIRNPSLGLYKVLGGVTKGKDEEERPTEPLGLTTVLGLLGPLARHPGTVRSGAVDDVIRSRFDAVGLKDASSRAQVRAEAVPLVSALRRYVQFEQRFNARWGPMAGMPAIEPDALAPTPPTPGLSLFDLATPPVLAPGGSPPIFPAQIAPPIRRVPPGSISAYPALG